MKVLVTGGAGFIASHVTDRLVAAGHQVTVLDNLEMGRRSNVNPEAAFVEMDIRDAKVAALFEQERFEAMVHAAAQMDVRRSVENPSFDADVNICGLLNLLEAGRLNGLQHVVFTSTGGAAYDDHVSWPTPETAPARPVSPYGIAKIASELYLNYYHHQYGLTSVSLRLGNVYGPRQNPHGEAGVVAIFSRKLLGGEGVTINGDGRQTRDYVFVEDVARAIELGLQHRRVEVLNVGTAVETDVVELYAQIRRAVGVELQAEHGPSKPGEVRRSCLDPGQIGEVLGWKADVVFADGIDRTVEFFRCQQADPDAR